METTQQQIFPTARHIADDIRTYVDGYVEIGYELFTEDGMLYIVPSELPDGADRRDHAVKLYDGNTGDFYVYRLTRSGTGRHGFEVSLYCCDTVPVTDGIDRTLAATIHGVLAYLAMFRSSGNHRAEQDTRIKRAMPKRGENNG